MRYTNATKKFGQSALITALLFWFIACGEKTEETATEVVRPAKIFTISASGGGINREFPGKVRAAQQVDMSFNFAGTLVKLPVKEGQEIKKGNLIAAIDDRDLKNALAAERAKLKDSKASYERHKGLLEQAVTTAAEFDKVERMYEVQKVAVRIAQKAFDDATLEAPFSGRIAKRYVDNHKEVMAKEPIVSLQDISSMEILVDLPESVIAHVRKKSTATVVAEFPVLPGKKFALKAKEVALQADPQTQTYQVVLTLPIITEANILPGMTATVTATAKGDAKQPDTFLVPLAAVFADEAGKRLVWKVGKDMKVQKHPVEVGAVTGDRIRITKGLKPGEKIVTAGVNFLEPGQEVRPIQTDSK